ncbi:zinc transporter [Malassezia pachydermatis]|uniref:Zinc transporter n=1 Tax=Malassezia pachydermatis TaxID=77020 RepID=A0A0M8MNB6_9BASI|nr:zinc transporter [Malassezia pachydermatis]KOS15956.1 zinc transporter [Malassezia pachydermatis]
MSIRRPYADTLDEFSLQTISFSASLQDNIGALNATKGYGSLLAYAVLSIEAGQLMFTASKDVGGRRRAMVLANAIASVIVLPLSTMGAMLGFKMLPAPLVPNHDPTPQDALEFGHMAAYLVLAVGLLIFDVLVTLTLESYVTLMVHALHAWPMAIFFTMAIGFGVFNVKVSIMHILVAMCVGFALYAILRRSPLYMTTWYRSATLEEQRVAQQGADTDTTALSELVILWYQTAIQIRSIIRVILSKSDSRRIFLFLCINLAFMGVQLLWGVWTNSLGLISDAIHMFFDCAAIFMGLIASVMATWDTDATFPFGYKRVETLSGFANGIFLVLISVFILFEAIQRIIEPPEMNNMTQFTILIHYFHWTGFDPIASLLIGLMILGSVIPLVVDSGRILCLDMGSMDTSTISKALSKISAIPGVSGYSDARFWSLDGESLIGSIHVHYDTPLFSAVETTEHAKVVDPSRLVLQVEALLRGDIHGLDTVTVQANPRGDCL